MIRARILAKLVYREIISIPDFNLHVREAAIAQAWVVRKPSADGMISALECYDAKGQLIVQLFGKRKPGIPELEQWRGIIANAESAHRLA